MSATQSTLRLAARLARPVARAPIAAQRRSINHLGKHVAHNNFPFSYANKRAFGVKYATACTTFFLIPFIAVGYQLRKSAGNTA